MFQLPTLTCIAFGTLGWNEKKGGEIRDYRNVYAEIGVSFEPGTSRTLSENYTPKPISLNGCLACEIFLTVSWATKSVK